MVYGTTPGATQGVVPRDRSLANASRVPPLPRRRALGLRRPAALAALAAARRFFFVGSFRGIGSLRGSGPRMLQQAGQSQGDLFAGPGGTQFEVLLGQLLLQVAVKKGVRTLFGNGCLLKRVLTPFLCPPFLCPTSITPAS